MKILAVDDHPVFLYGLTSMLSRYAQFEVTQAQSGASALKIAKETHPDIVLVDLIMPEMNGIQLITAIKEDKDLVQSHIIVLSSDGSEQAITQAIQAGIDGFVSKNASEQSIIESITTVYDGFQYFGQDISTTIARIKDATAAPDSLFTSRELEVIRLSCEGMIYKEIANAMGIAQRTVESYKRSIFQKLGVDTTVKVVLYAIKHGLVRL